MLLLAGGTEEEAAGQYAQRYGIDAGQAAVDVRTVADALAAQGLATAEPVSRRRWRGWWR
ncbi:PqqD family peptide modification chaperone [[Kitasatospora] papulosa]|uniref:PqqD family peptide modification chaperone n=1 Tax=[Kitasatospora] papulosa TaxID=1464011 RepID=UPI003694337E